RGLSPCSLPAVLPILAPEVLIGMGFLAFSTTMTLGRFLGDGISAKIGPIKIVGLGAFIAALGYLLVLTQHTTLSIIGFAFNGLGDRKSTRLNSSHGKL